MRAGSLSTTPTITPSTISGKIEVGCRDELGLLIAGHGPDLSLCHHQRRAAKTANGFDLHARKRWKHLLATAIDERRRRWLRQAADTLRAGAN